MLQEVVITLMYGLSGWLYQDILVEWSPGWKYCAQDGV